MPLKTPEIPVFEGDLFSQEALKTPFPIYKEIRDMGPVVYSPKHDFYAIGRYADVKLALRAAETLISGKGVGLNPIINAPQGESAQIIATDGEKHKRMRKPIFEAIGPKPVQQYRDRLKEMVSKHIETLKGAGWVEGVTSIAQYLPVSVVSHLVGVPEEGRQNLLRWASAGFDLVGPDLDALGPQIEVLMEAIDFMATVEPRSLKEGSWSEALFQCVERGELSELEARAALAAYILPSLDTTIYAKSNLLFNLGQNPDQWQKLKSNPGLVLSAVLEGVRHSAIVRLFTRFAESDYSQGDVSLPKGARVALLFGSANRDERHYEDPDAFMVDRNPRDQLGWGHGIHMCGGMHLAKLEMEVLLEAMVEQVKTIEVDAPEISTNFGLYGIESMQVRLT
ncbi:MAG: cytochrome P450 [Pseudomonadota bacterium]